MSRRLIAAAVTWAAVTGTTGIARADEAEADDTTVDVNADGGIRDQEIGARLGLVSGGRSTPGGLRVGAQYLYQLDDQVWFDGALLFTFGGGGAECFRDRDNDVVCDHGRLDGTAGEVAFAVRYFLGMQAHGLHPYVRAGAALRLVRFGDDGVTGLAIPLLGGAGMRVRVAPTVAVGVEAQLELGGGVFSDGLGVEPQAGLQLGALVEIALP